MAKKRTNIRSKCKNNIAMYTFFEQRKHQKQANFAYSTQKRRKRVVNIFKILESIGIYPLWTGIFLEFIGIYPLWTGIFLEFTPSGQAFFWKTRNSFWRYIKTCLNDENVLKRFKTQNTERKCIFILKRMSQCRDIVRKLSQK